MKYEVINEKNKPVLRTDYFSSIADIDIIKAMLNAGYKIVDERC